MERLNEETGMNKPAMPGGAVTAVGARRAAIVVAPKSLTQQISDHIRSEIIHDNIKPGEWIREKALTDQFGISRTPLREALQILATQRLIEIIPNRGAVVVALSDDEIRHLLQVYVRLDVFAAELACVHATSVDDEAIRHHLDTMAEAYRVGDRYAYFDANQAFHLGIAAASHNPVLIEMHAQLNLRLYRTRYLGVLQAENWAKAVNEHEPIAEAFLSRNAQLLARLVSEHLGFAWRMVSSDESGDAGAKPAELARTA
ncbi:GntR family transcriptional regulator [Bosea sp. AS-1]|uniref:GntR family transcriptional regulator n=1 Tax=Bosea sp. AS-1 TaxID=2015316 RepID=UPI0018DF67DD|nr:GntR family transcriptional regulator [Bosea sp. AS-1]